MHRSNATRVYAAVCNVHGVPPLQLLGTDRTRNACAPTATRSTDFCAIWDYTSSSSSGLNNKDKRQSAPLTEGLISQIPKGLYKNVVGTVSFNQESRITLRVTWSKHRAGAMRPLRRAGWVWAGSCAQAAKRLRGLSERAQARRIVSP